MNEKSLEEIKEVDKIKLPKRWRYNDVTFRLEQVIDILDEDDNFMGTTVGAVTPRDIKQFIYDDYTPKSTMQQACEQYLWQFVRELTKEHGKLVATRPFSWSEANKVLERFSKQFNSSQKGDRDEKEGK